MPYYFGSNQLKTFFISLSRFRSSSNDFNLRILSKVVVQLYVLSIGEMLIKTFPYILNFSDIGKINEKEKGKEQKIHKNTWKHYIYLGLLYALNVGVLITVEVLN